jgi:hypothetical protein
MRGDKSQVVITGFDIIQAQGHSIDQTVPIYVMAQGVYWQESEWSCLRISIVNSA